MIDAQLVAEKALAEKVDQTPEFAKKLAHYREKLLIESEKADQMPEFAKKLAYYRQKLLMESEFERVARTAATDAAVKATYGEAAKALKPQTEIHARHILVATEEEAKAAFKRLMAGDEIATIAKEVSKDPGAKGGDLGWFTKDRMVPEFADAAFKLEVGQVSDPVKTPFGWHIIEMLDKREKTFPPLDKVKDQVTHYIMQKAKSAMVADLRKNANIEWVEGPEAPADLATSKPVTPSAVKKYWEEHLNQKLASKIAALRPLRALIIWRKS